LRLARIGRVELRARGLQAAMNLCLDVIVPFSVAAKCSARMCRDFSDLDILAYTLRTISPALRFLSLIYIKTLDINVARVTPLQESSNQIMVLLRTALIRCLPWN
jgi:hypothetical protein